MGRHRDPQGVRVSNEPMDFRAWLLRHVDEQSAIGDLARDVQSDYEWPEGESESLELYSDHLESMNASVRVLDILEDAWNQYDGIRP